MQFQISDHSQSPACEAAIADFPYELAQVGQLAASLTAKVAAKTDSFAA